MKNQLRIAHKNIKKGVECAKIVKKLIQMFENNASHIKTYVGFINCAHWHCDAITAESGTVRKRPALLWNSGSTCPRNVFLDTNPILEINEKKMMGNFFLTF